MENEKKRKELETLHKFRSRPARYDGVQVTIECTLDDSPINRLGSYLENELGIELGDGIQRMATVGGMEEITDQEAYRTMYLSAGGDLADWLEDSPAGARSVVTVQCRRIMRVSESGEQEMRLCFHLLRLGE